MSKRIRLEIEITQDWLDKDLIDTTVILHTSEREDNLEVQDYLDSYQEKMEITILSRTSYVEHYNRTKCSVDTIDKMINEYSVRKGTKKCIISKYSEYRAALDSYTI
ncbi:hypothetical protein ILUMI_02888 [Ignelater luminosus]|uniref:Uncharacterized protein n=1 Tax=Ignelater luminosus TaxID=2038154 RepID=A0A8K0GKG1_IGNLU|nr:hypothetical protein ILUMI_02888 [Ignelater luminosus]